MSVFRFQWTSTPALLALMEHLFFFYPKSWEITMLLQ